MSDKKEKENKIFIASVICAVLGAILLIGSIYYIFKNDNKARAADSVQIIGSILFFGGLGIFIASNF